MSVLIVGMSHRCAPVALLEQISMDEDAKIRVSSALLRRPSLTEALVVSTCNRVEIYCVTSSFHAGVNDVVDVIHEYSGVNIDTLRAHLYVRYADAAAQHMLMVTAGLDSMVIGEQQIIGQVRQSYQLASEIGAAGPALHALAQTALHTGKRVHTETDIDDTGASMVSFALNRALQVLYPEAMSCRTDATMRSTDATACAPTAGDDIAPAGGSDLAAMPERPLAGVRVLLLGAGAMASLAATHLGKLGVEKIMVANRTLSRAQTLVSHALEAGVDAEAVSFEKRAEILDSVAMVVSATGSESYTIRAEDIPAGHPGLIAIDLSLPRDLDDAIADVPGCTLINIERLHEVASGHDGTMNTDAIRIVHEALDEFTSQQRVRDVVPAVAALHKHAAELMEAELEQLERRTPDMDERERHEVSRTVRRIVDKLLHQPTVRVKELAARSGTVSYESALQELFGIGGLQSVSVRVDELPQSFDRIPQSATAVAQTYPSHTYPAGQYAKEN